MTVAVQRMTTADGEVIQQTPAGVAHVVLGAMQLAEFTASAECSHDDVVGFVAYLNEQGEPKRRTDMVVVPGTDRPTVAPKEWGVDTLYACGHRGP